MRGSNDLTLTPLEIKPTVVLAYDATGDASKVEELVYRNRIPFPLFLEKKPLKISGYFTAKAFNPILQSKEVFCL